MLLCMDERGNIYQASRDREDGRGFEIYPQASQNGDVYVQGAAIKSNLQVQNAQDADSALNAQQDDQALQDQYEQQNMQDAVNQANQQADMQAQIPAYKNQLTTEAAIDSMSGPNFSRNSIWGASSPLTATGMGRTHEEIARELAWYKANGKIPPRATMRGIGDATISTDQEEINQANLTQQASQQTAQAAAGQIAASQQASVVPTTAVTTAPTAPNPMNTVTTLGIGLLLLAGLNYLRKA